MCHPWCLFLYSVLCTPDWQIDSSSFCLCCLCCQHWPETRNTGRWRRDTKEEDKRRTDGYLILTQLTQLTHKELPQNVASPLQSPHGTGPLPVVCRNRSLYSLLSTKTEIQIPTDFTILKLNTRQRNRANSIVSDGNRRIEINRSQCGNILLELSIGKNKYWRSRRMGRRRMGSKGKSPDGKTDRKRIKDMETNGSHGRGLEGIVRWRGNGESRKRKKKNKNTTAMMKEEGVYLRVVITEDT